MRTAATLLSLTVLSVLTQVWVWALVGFSEEVGTAWALTSTALACGAWVALMAGMEDM